MHRNNCGLNLTHSSENPLGNLDLYIHREKKRYSSSPQQSDVRES